MDRRTWNINNFNMVNLPEVIGKIESPIGHYSSDDDLIRVLDMPIHMPNQGFRIPEFMLNNAFHEAIEKACISEMRFGDFTQDHYVYVTIDQKIVKAGNTGRRAGAHSDAYVEKFNEQFDITTENANVLKDLPKEEVSHTYIVADCFPTEFFNAPFPLVDTSCEGSLQTFDEIANSAPVITYPAHTLLRLDPFVVHRCAIADETRHRTFMKISFSRKKYARIGNTINPNFHYSWEMTARSPDSRNHPWS